MLGWRRIQVRQSYPTNTVGHWVAGGLAVWIIHVTDQFPWWAWFLCPAVWFMTDMLFSKKGPYKGVYIEN